MPNHVAELLDEARQAFATITPAEEKLFIDIANGDVASFLTGQEQIDDPENAGNWGADRTINARCIQWLCATPRIKELLAAKRIRVRGAKIEGEFRLDHMQIDLVLGFSQCVFSHLISLEKTKLLSLEIPLHSHWVIVCNGPGIFGNLMRLEWFRS